MKYVVIVSALGLALTGCSASDASGANADLGNSASDMGAAADAGSCATIKVTPVQGTAPTTLTAVAQVSTGAKPTWSVSTPAGFITPQLDSSGLIATVQANDPGSYLFHVEFAGGSPCPGNGSALVVAPSALGQAYRVRLSPPASSQLPQQDKLITIYGDTPQTNADLILDAGGSFGGVLKSSTGAIAGEVQLFPQSGPEVRVAVGTNGSFSLPIRLDAMYRLLLIPKDAALAPHLIGPVDGATLATMSTIVGAGEPFSGVLHDPLAAPLSGARVALRAGVLPSGLGTSIVDGSFALRAEAGTYQLAAAADGWPEITLDGVVVVAGGSSVTLDQALTRFAVTLRVLRSDGLTPVAGAQVHLRSLPLAGAATITASDGPHSASGVARLERTTSSDGTLAVANLPAGTYDIFIETPDLGTAALDGTSGLRVVVSGAASIDLVLSARVPLTGHVRTPVGAVVAGARVRAIPKGAGPIVETTTLADGSYALALAKGVPVDLVIDPPASAALSSVRTHLGALDGALGGALPSTAEVMLGPGLQIGGNVLGPSAAPLGGVGIDVLCVSCGDSVPIAHGESNAVGAYTVSLPNPGLSVLDAGTD